MNLCSVPDRTNAHSARLGCCELSAISPEMRPDNDVDFASADKTNMATGTGWTLRSVRCLRHIWKVAGTQKQTVQFLTTNYTLVYDCRPFSV